MLYANVLKIILENKTKEMHFNFTCYPIVTTGGVLKKLNLCYFYG